MSLRSIARLISSVRETRSETYRQKPARLNAFIEAAMALLLCLVASQAQAENNENVRDSPVTSADSANRTDTNATAPKRTPTKRTGSKGSVDAPYSTASSPAPKRPSILFNRWQEDWSVLADPRVPRESFDSLKYIPLSPTDPKTYLSFGADFRERFEGLDAANFGIGQPNQDYLISRTEFHADLRVADQLQVFVQLQSNYAPWKTVITPVDVNPLDLEQAFLTLTEPVGDGTLKLRFGRQQMAFDLQRFISVRDGPNNRQSYDAAWGDYESGPWRFIAFYSHPVQDLPDRPFDDYSSPALTFGIVRAERKLFDWGRLIAYYGQFTQKNAKWLTVSGNELRNFLDTRLVIAANGFDGDLEFMGQSGTIGIDQIRAWAVGSTAGFTFKNTLWMPRFGLQFDAASGNSDPQGNVLRTFNPLFPIGYYFTLAGFTGYTNLIHFKQLVTLNFSSSTTLLLAVAEQWRETTADAVYTQPDTPVAGTAGKPGRYTGHYYQTRLDWTLDSHSSFAIEAVRFVVSDVIRQAGGHDGDYIGVQYAYGW